MKHQALRIVALMLSVLLAAAAPAQAGTIHFADVMQAAAEGRRGPWADLRLRAIQQQGGKAAPGVVVATTAQKTDTGATSAAGAPDGSTAGDKTPSLISPDTAQQQGTVETIDLGDVTGTVCDCGVLPGIEVPAGGFPLWPLAGLAAIPFLFIDRDNPPPDDIPPGPGPTPTTTPPPPAVPEPATLLLFGSGLLALGAGARRRRGIKALEVVARDQEVV